MTENRYGERPETVLKTVLSTAADSALLVDPTVELLDGIVTVLSETPEVITELRVLARASVLKTVRDDFLIASRVADLVDRGTVELRVAPDSLQSTLVISDLSMSALVSNDGQLTALTSDDETFLADSLTDYDAQYEAGEAFSLRTPGRTQLLETIDTEFGSAMREDVQAVLTAVDAVTGDPDHLGIVQIVLLLAAKHEQLLYDLGRWSEDVGLASKATLSRTKTDLEDAGLLTTEKVPIDVGRPRMRLLLDHDDLVGVSAEKSATTALNLLS